MPTIMWTALSLAAFSGSFVPLMNLTMDPLWDANKKLSMSLFAMIPLGAGEIIGSLVMGKISDKFGYQVGLKLVMVLTILGFVLVFITISTFKFNYMTFLMTFAWGLQDSAVSNFVNCVLAFEFEDKLAPFSVYKFSQSLFTFIFLVVASKIDEKDKYYYYFASIAVWSALSLSMMLCFKYKGK